MENTKQTPYSTCLKDLSEMKDYVGKELGLTDWMTMEQSRINTFADATEDHQWIHIDPERSAAFSPYKKTVAHGFLVLSMASKITAETFQVENMAMGVNYGLDKVRFPNATHSGAFFRGRVSLLESNEIPGGVKYKVKIVFEIKGEDKPACVAEFLVIAYAGPGKEQQAAMAKATEKAPPSDSVLYEKQGPVGVITLNRPERYNAVLPEVTDRLIELIKTVQEDTQVKAVVLTGAGKGFCAGADMLNFDNATPEELSEGLTVTYQTLMRQFSKLKKPLIGAINGSAAGIGAAIALACDLRVMSPSSSILYAFVNIGLGPDGGAAYFLARQVGYAKAFEIAAEGKKIPADECLSLGLTNKIVPEDELLSAAINWGKQLAEKPAIALGILKADMHYAMENSLHDVIAFEAEQQLKGLKSQDFREGVTAFKEKRNPKFIGK